MLTLITFPAGFNDPSYSPFCTKAMCLLQMSGLEWQRRDVHDPRKSPRGQLPVLEDAGALIPDSQAIRAHLERAHGADFDTGLSAAQKATSIAFIRLAENHLRQYLVYDRWLDDGNWAIVRDVFFGGMPRLIRGPVTRRIRASVKARLTAEGAARLSSDERLAWAGQDLEALETQLGDQPFMFGDTPSGADASIAPVLTGIANLPAPTALQKALQVRPALMGYAERMRARCYPSV